MGTASTLSQDAVVTDHDVILTNLCLRRGRQSPQGVALVPPVQPQA